ncbi:MAG: carboxy terminal-processing peptidase [Flavisolibacter sp.]
MKRLPLLLALMTIGIFLAFRTLGTTGSNNPPSKYEKILGIVGSILTQGHYSPKEINDEFSKKVFNQYFEDLDPEKNIFLKQDLTSLQKYATAIDDEIKGAPVQFFAEAGKVFDTRVDEAAGIYKAILAKPFDFSVNETYTTDPQKKSFPATDAERRDAWRKYLKFLTLQRFVDMQEARESNKGKEGAPAYKDDATLEKEARQKVSDAMDRRFEHYKAKFNEDEKFTMFVNVITNLMDPHTEFMPPLDKRYFDEMLSGSFFGIGAQLQYDEGNIKIASVLPGGPAAKSGQVDAGDLVVRVAQGADTAVEIVGYNVEDAVKIIRGKKGSEVRLTLRKKDGQLKNVNLIREEIVQDEAYVRSAVINQDNGKIGYIFLPEFYANFDNPNKPRSGNDVAKELVKLKQENVDGIVLDLRNNGGGSLYDVIQIAGLFIDKGPVVQVRDRQGKPQVMDDRDPTVLWDGPLVVMVNEMSASASEILAAAIQDYGRGLVIGSTSTYGKGTVQRPIGLDPQNFMNTNSELGSLKLTLQKFYRINGGSTQMHGVASDIVVPDYMEYLKLRERENPNALPWDEVKKADYKKWTPTYNPEQVKQTAATRIAADSVFRKLKNDSQVIGKQSEREYSLQINKYKQDQKQMRDVMKDVEQLIKMETPMQIAFLKQDESKYYSEDKDKTERYKQWLTNISKDIYVDEAVKVINDMSGKTHTSGRTIPVASNKQ